MREILDISSDEEEGLDESLTVNDYNFIREMLFSSDEESDDSVKVVEIRENKPEVKSKSSTLAVDLGGDDDDDDDDCVVLECDPENGVASVEEEANGSDELLVIGEKGQVKLQWILFSENAVLNCGCDFQYRGKCGSNCGDTKTLLSLMTLQSHIHGILESLFCRFKHLKPKIECCISKQSCPVVLWGVVGRAICLLGIKLPYEESDDGQRYDEVVRVWAMHLGYCI
ncbi:hypothetical protein ACSQ67_014743 [Phaseolus vulgaris]